MVQVNLLLSDCCSSRRLFALGHRLSEAAQREMRDSQPLWDDWLQMLIDTMGAADEDEQSAQVVCALNEAKGLQLSSLDDEHTLRSSPVARWARELLGILVELQLSIAGKRQLTRAQLVAEVAAARAVALRLWLKAQKAQGKRPNKQQPKLPTSAEDLDGEVPLTKELILCMKKKKPLQDNMRLRGITFVTRDTVAKLQDKLLQSIGEHREEQPVA